MIYWIFGFDFWFQNKLLKNEKITQINKRLCKRLSDYFKDNIKLWFIAEQKVIIVTKDDRVYQFDEEVNKTYSLIAYTCDESVVKELIKKSIVEEICNDIKNGLLHTIARTSDGKVYVWGDCCGGVLGNGIDDKNIYRSQLNKIFKWFKFNW